MEQTPSTIVSFILSTYVMLWFIFLLTIRGFNEYSLIRKIQNANKKCEIKNLSAYGLNSLNDSLLSKWHCRLKADRILLFFTKIYKFMIISTSECLLTCDFFYWCWNRRKISNKTGPKQQEFRWPQDAIWSMSKPSFPLLSRPQVFFHLQKLAIKSIFFQP